MTRVYVEFEPDARILPEPTRNLNAADVILNRMMTIPTASGSLATTGSRPSALARAATSATGA